jgi:hypothetical protein
MEDGEVNKERRHTGLSLEEVLGFESSNVRDGSEDISAVGSRSFDTVSASQLSCCQIIERDVPVIDTPLSSLVINVKVLQVVVEINTSSTEVSSEESSVGGKDGSYVDMPFPAEGNGETGLPFVEVGYDCCFGFSGCELISASDLRKNIEG